MNRKEEPLKNPTVSVLMSVYNGGVYLRAAIESILSQTFQDYEFIIVNDGSSDDSQSIIESVSDSRIVRISNESNIGLVKSLNVGLRVAKGTYIARMDADDLSRPERLEKQVRFLSLHPEVGVLGTAMDQIDGSGNPIVAFVPPRSHNLIAWKMFFECCTAHATVMMRRELLELVGGYDPNFQHIEDTELWSRLIRVTKFANLDERLYIRRWLSDSICNSFFETQYKLAPAIKERLVKEVLNEAVESSIIEKFAVAWPAGQKYSLKDSLAAASLIANIAAIISRSCSSSIEKKKILKDAARRIYRMLNPWMVEVRTWRLLLKSFFWDPFLIIRIIYGRLRKVRKQVSLNF